MPLRASGAEPERALTAIRGAAAWWVVVYHFRDALPAGTPALVRIVAAGGYLAVDLFFVLSGYVIALNYGRWFTAGRAPARGYRRFLWLRLSRIYPLHLLVLLAFLSVPAGLALHAGAHALRGLHVGYYLLSLFLMQNWGFVSGLEWNVPAWSISTEWLAYLLFPLLVVPAFRIGTDALRAACGVLVLAAGLAAVSAAIDPAGFTSDRQIAGIARCLFEFSMGVFVFLARARATAAPRRSLAMLGLALFGSALSRALGFPDYVLAPVCFAALVYALADESTVLARALHAAPLQALGVVSYSTYMSHFLIKVWIKFLLVRPGIDPRLPMLAYLLAVLAASFLLYRGVERPAQRWLRRVRPAWAAP